MKIDPDTLEPREAYRLFITCIVPRPIAFVSTVSPEGVTNAAPFSFFGGVSSNPPMLAVSIGRRRGEEKDTARNIRATGEFVVNVVTEDLAGRMNQASASYAADVSEFDAVGLTPLPSDVVAPPRIAESPLHMECVAERTLEVGAGPNLLAIGRVVRFHIDDALYSEGEVDVEALRPVGRLGGPRYARVRDLFELERPPP